MEEYITDDEYYSEKEEYVHDAKQEEKDLKASCPARYCIWSHDEDDEDYCFSPRMRFDPHAKCIQKQNESRYGVIVDIDYGAECDYVREIRDRYMPAFTLEQTERYMSIHPPSAYMCCDGCRSDCIDDHHLSENDRCDCCTGMCRCCAGVCGHN